MINALGGRRSGKTTLQMLSAPKDAIYVWVNGNIGYAKALAKTLGREDLVIKSPVYFEDNWRGSLVPVVLDHATYSGMTDRQCEGYRDCWAYLEYHGVI